MFKNAFGSQDVPLVPSSLNGDPEQNSHFMGNPNQRGCKIQFCAYIMGALGAFVRGKNFMLREFSFLL